MCRARILRGDMKNMNNSLVEVVHGRGHSEDLGVDGQIMSTALNCTSERQGVTMSTEHGSVKVSHRREI